MSKAATEPATLTIPESYAISPGLKKNLQRQMLIFQAWSEQLRPFSVQARTEEKVQVDTRVVSSFSGGVDSFFTALTHPEVTQLTHIRGFESSLQGKRPERLAQTRLDKAVSSLAKELVVIETNALDFFRHLRLQRYLIHGCLLACAGHLMGPKEYVVPNSAPLSNLDLRSGSHPLSDPGWSSDTVEITHDLSLEDRLEKMKLVYDSGFLNDLIVCAHRHDIYDHERAQNCGNCMKCIRTMLSIFLQGMHSTAFAEPLTLGKIRRCRPNNTVDFPLWDKDQSLSLARELKQHTWVRAMVWAELPYRLKEIAKSILKTLDDLLTGGRMTTFRQKRRMQQPRDGWFKITP